MMKILKIITLGLVMWGIGLLWPTFSQLLTQPMALYLGGVGLSLAGLALIGLIHWAEQKIIDIPQTRQSAAIHARMTQPLRPVKRGFHSQVTCPMPVITVHPASRPTRPVAV